MSPRDHQQTNCLHFAWGLKETVLAETGHWDIKKPITHFLGKKIRKCTSNSSCCKWLKNQHLNRNKCKKYRPECHTQELQDNDDCPEVGWHVASRGTKTGASARKVVLRKSWTTWLRFVWLCRSGPQFPKVKSGVSSLEISGDCLGWLQSCYDSVIWDATETRTAALHKSRFVVRMNFPRAPRLCGREEGRAASLCFELWRAGPDVNKMAHKEIINACNQSACVQSIYMCVCIYIFLSIYLFISTRYTHVYSTDQYSLLAAR